MMVGGVREGVNILLSGFVRFNIYKDLGIFFRKGGIRGELGFLYF